MPAVTCIGDGTTGTCDMKIPNCCSHGRAGTNGTGAALFEIEGKSLHCETHTGPCNCPHGGTFESVQGSSLLEVDGLAVTLVGHRTACMACGESGMHTSGSALLEVER